MRSAYMPLDRPGAATTPWLSAGIRALLYLFGLLLYLIPLASWTGMAAAMLAALAGMRLGTAAHRRGVRVGPVLILSPAALLASLAFGEWLQGAAWFSGWLGVRHALLTAEATGFGLAAAVIAFSLRFLAHRSRALSLLEVLFVAGSVSPTRASRAPEPSSTSRSASNTSSPPEWTVPRRNTFWA